MWVLLGILCIVWFVISLGLNILLFWYNRQLMVEKEDVINGVYEMKDLLEAYEDELERTLGMSLYSQDIILQNLLKKTTRTKENVERFLRTYFEEDEDSFDNTKKENNN